MNQTIKIDFNPEEFKLKLIAIAGQPGIDLQAVVNSLTMNKNIKQLKRVQAGSKQLPVNDFLQKIVQGDIIEATCEENDEIWGTDISDKFTGYLYVGIYTPEQIANIQDSGRVKVCPVLLEMNDLVRLNTFISNYKQKTPLKTILKEFLKLEEEYNPDEYLNNYHKRIYENNDELMEELHYHQFEQIIKQIIKETPLFDFTLADLDNFI